MLRPQLHIVTLAAEFANYARSRTGTVAEPVAELARALARLDGIETGVEVRAIIPRYQQLASGSADYSAFTPRKPVAVTGPRWGLAECEVSAHSPTERLSIWAIDCSPLLASFGVEPTLDVWGPMPDPEAAAPADVAGAARGTALTFGLFCAAAVRLIQHWHEDEGWPVHLLHLQGWPVGPVAAMLEPGHSPASWWPMWDGVGIWYTHYDTLDGNGPGHFSAGSCGLDPAQLAETLGLTPTAVSRRHPRATLGEGIFSFPASALNYIARGSHGLGANAVSPTRAQELTRESVGGRSTPLFQQARREGRLTGILGGIDLSDWDPRALDPPLDPALDTTDVLARKRDRSGLAPRLARQLEACRGDIEARGAGDEHAGFLHLLDRAIGQAGFAVGDSDVLVVATQAATWPAGLDLFAHPHVADKLLGAEPALKLVLAAAPNRADDQQSQALAALAGRWPERVLYVPWWSDDLERLLLGHADALLLPARVEPSGRAAMQAMRCFCVPIAHATGGLADVILDVQAWEDGLSPPDASGFLFRVSAAHDAPDFDAQARQALRERLGEMLDCHRAFREWEHPAWPALARNGFDRTSREFSWEARAREYLQHFEARR